MAKQKDRYTLVIPPDFSYYANGLRDFEKIPFSTLRLARSYYDILSSEEKERAYIYDNVKREKVV